MPPKKKPAVAKMPPKAAVVPEFQPTPAQSNLVELLAGYGHDVGDIAIYTGISEADIMASFPDTFEKGRVKFDVKVTQSLYEAAFGTPRRTETVYRDKTRANGIVDKIPMVLVHDPGRPPDGRLLIWLAQTRMGMGKKPDGDQNAASQIPENIDHARLSDAELQQFESLLRKMGYEAPENEPASQRRK